VAEVWKYKVGGREVVDGVIVLRIPAGGKVVHVGYQQGDAPCVWVLLDPEVLPEERLFYWATTGEEVNEEWLYVGTVMGASRVWHLFEVVGDEDG
jgi:hypothetical protein